MMLELHLALRAGFRRLRGMPAALLALLVACCAANSALGAAAKPSETLELIRKRGAIVVGVKTDYPPFGRLTTSGASEGLEHDLAADVARRLGVRLEKVAVSGANRLQKLEEGAVDVVIATTGDTAERRRVATMVEPNYYASGVTLLMGPEQTAQDWPDIRGKKVCAIQGSYFNRAMSQRYLLDLVIFNNARDAKLALRDGRCVGFLFDNTAVRSDLALPEWAGYQAPLPPAMTVPWAVVLARKDAGTELEQMLGDTLADWHRSGFLIAREKAWGMPASKFLSDMSALWQRPGVCVRQADGLWPAECRNPVYLTSGDVGGLRALGLWLREKTNIDLSLVYDDYDRGRFLRGLLLTVLLMLACALGSAVVGVVVAIVAQHRWRALRWPAKALTVYGRMTPPLLQMYLLLFGLGAVLWANFGISLSPIAVAVWCLSFYTGSSVANSLDEGVAHLQEQEPGYELHWSTLRRVAAVSSGPIAAALINVSKATMMASAISVPELLSNTTAIVSDNGNVAVMMNALLLVFFILVGATQKLLVRVERWLRSGAGAAL